MTALDAKQAHAAGTATPDSHSQVDASKVERDPFAEGEVDFRTVGWMKGRFSEQFRDEEFEAESSVLQLRYSSQR